MQVCLRQMLETFAQSLMVANAATKLFDPSTFIGTNINGDGTYPSGQTLSTLTAAIQSEYKYTCVPYG